MKNENYDCLYAVVRRGCRGVPELFMPDSDIPIRLTGMNDAYLLWCYSRLDGKVGEIVGIKGVCLYQTSEQILFYLKDFVETPEGVVEEAADGRVATEDVAAKEPASTNGVMAEEAVTLENAEAIEGMGVSEEIHKDEASAEFEEAANEYARVSLSEWGQRKPLYSDFSSLRCEFTGERGELWEAVLSSATST